MDRYSFTEGTVGDKTRVISRIQELRGGLGDCVCNRYSSSGQLFLGCSSETVHHSHANIVFGPRHNVPFGSSVFAGNL